MNTPRPWVMMPSNWIIQDKKLLNFNWKNQAGQKSTALAALELYICICFFSNRKDTSENYGDNSYELIAELGYSDFNTLSGMSRALIRKGIQKLVNEGLIEVRPNGKKSSAYVILGFDSKKGWCKLPARALISNDSIIPFKRFTRRSKYELHAVKLFLLLAAQRDNDSLYSMSSYDTINEYAGITRSDIKRTQTLMITTDLLEKIDFEREKTNFDKTENRYVPKTEEQLRHRSANKYYLKGYQGFLTGKKPSADAVPAEPEKPSREVV